MSKIDWGFEGTNFNVSADTNEDGEASISLGLSMTEAISEIGSLIGGKKEVVEIPVKVLRLTSQGGKLTVEVDPNTDGNPLLKVSADLAEIADEIVSAIG